jgi:hypothetical protein
MSEILEATIKVRPDLSEFEAEVEEAAQRAEARLAAATMSALHPDFATITIDTDAPAEAALDIEPARWEGVLALEGIPTDDNMGTPRIIMPESLSWRPLPLPLMAMIEDKGGEHAGHKLAGRIDEIWRVPRPDLAEHAFAIMGRGVFDSSEEDETGEYGRMVGRLVREKTLRGVSIDPVAVEWALVDGETLEVVEWETIEEAELAGDLVRGRFYAAMTSASIGAATVCPLQALEGATIEIFVASATGDPSVRIAGTLSILDEEPFTACAAGPLAPSASWFVKPRLRKLTPLAVSPEGQLSGHLQTWECHVGYEDRCMRARPSRDGYARFHTGALVTAEGEHIRVGRIQVKPHAHRRLSIDETIAYYSDPATVAAFVCIYDDEFGIACAGTTRSDASPELLRDFYANPPSGEWRRGELMGFSCVPLPGLPVTSPEAYLVASVGSELEVDLLILPGVTEEDVATQKEATEADVFIAAAALQGPEALAALIAE